MFFRCRKTRRSGTCRTTVTFEVPWWRVVVTRSVMWRMIIIMMMVPIIVTVRRRRRCRSRSLLVMIMTVVVVAVAPMVLVTAIPQRYNRWTKGWWWWSCLILLMLLLRRLVFVVRTIIVVVMMTTRRIQRRGWRIVVVVVAIIIMLNWFYIVSSNRLGFTTSSTSFQILLTYNGCIWDRGSRRWQWLIRGSGGAVHINCERHICWWGLLPLLLKYILFSWW